MPENSNQNQVNSENEKSESKISKFNIPLRAIKAIAGLVKMIPQGLSPQEKGVLFILIIAAILLLGFGLYLGLSGEPIYCLIAFLATLALFFYAMFFIINSKQKAKDKFLDEDRKRRSEKNERLRVQIQEEETKAAQELAQNGNLAWTREVIKLPLPDDDKRREIVQEMVDLRNAAFSWLNERHTDLQKSQIRTNIFLAKYEEAGKGVVCMLRMPEYFRLGMRGHTDEEVAFRPGEGSTGRAFVEHESDVAIFDESARTWDERYTLTEYQKRKIHKQLRWIITYPLKNTSGEAMAVLNLDCLGLKVEEDELHRMKADMQHRIDQIEAKLNEHYEKVRISINVEKLS